MRAAKLLGAGGLAAIALTASPAVGQSTDTPKLLANESVVRVQAEGYVERMPDAALVGITIQSDGRTPGEAVQSNSAKLAALMADLQSLRVKEASISADELAAQPVYAEVDGNQDRSKVKGYRARQTVGINISDLGQLQAVIARLVQDGYGDLRADFEISDSKAVEAEAQRVAVVNAKAEANNLAAALGKRVSRLLLIGNSAEAYRGWTSTGQDIIVSGSRISPLILKPAPMRVESKVYVDWSLIDAN